MGRHHGAMVSCDIPYRNAKPKRHAALEASPPRSVDAFTDAVFAAEGIDPSNGKRLYAQVHEKVQRRVGQWMYGPSG